MRTTIAALVVLLATSASAAELLMFEQRGCSYCRRWDAEIGGGYAASDEGRIAPLRRLDIHAKVPADIALKRNVTITPTFVLIDGGSEVGRIVGYAGADFFYPMLDDVIAKLPRADASAASMAEPGKSPR